MVGKLKLYAAAAILVVLTVLKIYTKGKSDAAGDYARRRVDAINRAKEVEHDVEGDVDIADRARQWVRDYER